MKSIKFILALFVATVCVFAASAAGIVDLSGLDISTITAANFAGVFVSTDKERGAYERAYEKIQDIFGDASEYIIHQLDLRVETLLKANKDTVIWDLVSGNSNNDGPVEIRLDRNDIFFITDWALRITKRDEVNNIYADYPDYTYPEATFFVGNNSESLHLIGLYKSKMEFRTGNVSRIQDFSSNNFLLVPERIAPTAVQYQQFGPTKEDRGFCPMHPSPVIDGLQDNKFTLTMPPGTRTAIEGTVDGAGSAVDTRNVAVLLLKGFVVRNAGEKALRYTKGGNTWF